TLSGKGQPMLPADFAPPHIVTVMPARALQGIPRIPGAKYATVRAVLAAALADGTSTIDGVPATDDSRVLLAALQTLGIPYHWLTDERITVTGQGGRFPNATPDLLTIDAGNAGAVLRFLLGIGATQPA